MFTQHFLPTRRCVSHFRLLEHRCVNFVQTFMPELSIHASPLLIEKCYTNKTQLKLCGIFFRCLLNCSCLAMQIMYRCKSNLVPTHYGTGELYRFLCWPSCPHEYIIRRQWKVGNNYVVPYSYAMDGSSVIQYKLIIIFCTVPNKHTLKDEVAVPSCIAECCASTEREKIHVTDHRVLQSTRKLQGNKKL